MYQFVTGPLAWVAFLIFFLGIIYRGVWYIRGLDWKLDRVAYTEHAVYGARGAIRSILVWLIPFGTHSWRFYKGMTVLVFGFHIGLLFTPIFLRAHNIILAERWGFSLWSLPEGVADFLTVVVIVTGICLALRRFSLPQVRIITTAYD
jgi:nitrate reductase gamma subunit